MADMLKQSPSDKRALLGALAGFGAGVLAAGLAAHLLAHREPVKPATAAVTPTPAAADASKPLAPALPRALPDSPELLAEQLSRNRQFFGDDAQARIQGAFVVVVGVGGVGSHCVHMLARAGVGRVRMIDFDNVSLSSLNRHATATRDDVGTPKVAAMARAFARIVPSCRVEAVQRIFSVEAAETLLGAAPLDKDGNPLPASALAATAAAIDRRAPDSIVDCIDDKDTKSGLLDYCYRHRLRVVSSLGAGGKADPTRLHVADLTQVKGEALATSIKTHMRRERLCGFGSGAATTPAAATADAVVLPATTDHDVLGLPAGLPVRPIAGTLGYYLPGDPLRTAASGKRKAVQAAEALKSRRAGGSGTATAAAATAVGDGAGVDGSEYSESLRMAGIPCLYSSEEPRAALLPLDIAEGSGDRPEDFGALPGFRVRVIPVLGTMPAIFGQTLAAYVLCGLAGATHALSNGAAAAAGLPAAAGAGGSGGGKRGAGAASTASSGSAGSGMSEGPPLIGPMLDRLLGDFSVRDTRLHLSTRCSIGMEDVVVMVNDMWRGRSALSFGDRLGTKGVNLCIARWRHWLPSTLGNLVLVTEDQAEWLQAQKPEGAEVAARALGAHVAGACNTRAAAAGSASNGNTGGAAATAPMSPRAAGSIAAVASASRSPVSDSGAAATDSDDDAGRRVAAPAAASPPAPAASGDDDDGFMFPLAFTTTSPAYAPTAIATAPSVSLTTVAAAAPTAPTATAVPCESCGAGAPSLRRDPFLIEAADVFGWPAVEYVERRLAFARNVLGYR